MRRPPGPDDPSTVGSFRIVGVLGAGGMGRVLLGEDPSGRLAAVKLVHTELVDADGFRDRFRREVRLAAQAPPGWTAPFLDADPDAPQPWLATAYLDAPSLAEQLDEYGPCAPAEAAGIGAGLAAALSALHAAGLVHRDLTPSNVLLTDGGPRLIDFGISRAVDGTALTRTGQAVGTPDYMSPEQVTGGEAGPASDVFALGSVLAFATTGRTPFTAASPAAALYRVVHFEPRLDGVGPLEPVLRACLRKDPAARPPLSWVRTQLAALAGTGDEDDDPVRPDDTREAPGPGAAPSGPRHAAPLSPGAGAHHPPGAAAHHPPGAAGPWSAPPGAGPGWPPPVPYPSGPPPSPPPPAYHGPVPAPPPRPSRNRTPLLVAGAVVLALLVGAGATLGVLALRSGSPGPDTVADATTPPAASSVPPTGSPSTTPAADPVPGATVVDPVVDPRYGQPSGPLMFTSPSGNIACVLQSSGVTCDVAERTWQVPPKPASCALAFGTGVALGGSGPGTLSCVGGLSADPASARLDYDRALRLGEFVCVSRTAGVECRNTATGHGFAVARAAYRVY